MTDYLIVHSLFYIFPFRSEILDKRNLKIKTENVVKYCKEKILDGNCNIYKQGKKWYCEVDNIIITVNSYSYTIITVHTKK